ncbi:MAG: MtrB/PioB family outer membrane beta-barrel protein [Thermoanaerobaculia bacterium]
MSKNRNPWLALAALVALVAGIFLLAAVPLAAQEETATDPAETGTTAAEQSQTDPTQADQTQIDQTQAEPGSDQAFTFTVHPIAFGVLESDVDTDSSKWEEYRDLGSGFVIPILNIEGRGADDRFLDFRGVNVSREDARYTFSYGVLERYSLTVDYNKIPHRFGNNGHMLWTQTSPGVYEIADPAQAAIQAALEKQFAANRNLITFPFLNNLISPYLATAQEVDLALIRNRTQANLVFGGLQGFSWGLEHKHENRNGNRAYGASFGFSNATELPEVIDYSIDDTELAGEWNTEKSGLRFGLRHSSFKNDVSTMYWDNPFRLTGATDPSAYSSPGSGSIGGSGVGFADLWADNQADMAFVNGRTELGSWFVQGNLSYNVMTQDDPLLPYTLNTSIKGIGFNHEVFDATDPGKLPTRNADNEVDVTNVVAKAGTTFGDNFDLTFNFRLYDYDNQSRRIEFPGYVRFHAVWEEIARITVPHSYTKQDLGAEFGWNMARSTRLALSYNLQTWDREFREVDSSDEDILRLTFDTQPTAAFGVRASYEMGDRTIDEYLVEAQEFTFVESEGITNQPGLRKYDEAAREYDQFNVQASYIPTEAWNFFFGVTGRDENYDESELGLLDDEILQYNAEIGYAPGENLNLYLFGHIADRDSFQAGRQSGATVSLNPLDNWTAAMNEVTETYGLGFTTKRAPWTADLSARYTKSDGDIDFTAFPGGQVLGNPPRPVVDIFNYEDVELLAFLARFDYRITPNATAGFGYRWEDYTIDSFLIQGLRNYLPGTLLLNPDYGDYTGSTILLDLSLAF